MAREAGEIVSLDHETGIGAVKRDRDKNRTPAPLLTFCVDNFRTFGPNSVSLSMLTVGERLTFEVHENFEDFEDSRSRSGGGGGELAAVDCVIESAEWLLDMEAHGGADSDAYSDSDSDDGSMLELYWSDEERDDSAEVSLQAEEEQAEEQADGQAKEQAEDQAEDQAKDQTDEHAKEHVEEHAKEHAEDQAFEQAQAKEPSCMLLLAQTLATIFLIIMATIYAGHVDGFAPQLDVELCRFLAALACLSTRSLLGVLPSIIVHGRPGKQEGVSERLILAGLAGLTHLAGLATECCSCH